MWKIALLSTLFSTVVGSVWARQIQYIDQNVHERILFGDSWRGAYVKSFINKDWNVVRFMYCGTQTSGGFSSQCYRLPDRELRAEELPAFHQPLLSRFKALRDSLKNQVENSMWRRFMGGSEDLEVLEQIVKSLEEEGLENWILLREQEEMFPRFATQKMSDNVAKIIAKVLEKPAADAAPVPPPAAIPAAEPKTPHGEAETLDTSLYAASAPLTLPS